MGKIVEAFRFGVEEPAMWAVFCCHGWCLYPHLGAQRLHDGQEVNLVEAGTWHQALRH
jgi:hypothetical protein